MKEVVVVTLFSGRGRGGRGHLTSTTTRLPPSTHFVRPQPEPTSPSRSQLYSTSINNHRANSLEIELQRTYATTLPRYYGTRNGQSINATDYGDFRISMLFKRCFFLKICFSFFFLQNVRYVMNNHQIICHLLLIYVHILRMILIILVHLIKSIVNVQYVMMNFPHHIKLSYIKIKNI